MNLFQHTHTQTHTSVSVHVCVFLFIYVELNSKYIETLLLSFHIGLAWQQIANDFMSLPSYVMN